MAGILDVDDAAAAPDERRYALPAGHDEVLLDPSSLWYGAGIIRFPVGSAQRLPDLLEAFRTGRGIDWALYGPDVIESQEAANRPQFEHLVADWIGDLPDIAARLRDGTARVADVACGTGWSSISIARHFPGVQVDGIDVDEGSIARAAANAAAAGVADRVGFLTADGAAAEGAGRYDLVTIFEAVHDMARPVEVLAAARAPARTRWRGPRRGRADGRRLHGARATTWSARSTPTASCAACRAGSTTSRRSGTGHDAAAGRVRGDGPRRRLLALDRPAHASTSSSGSTASTRKASPFESRLPRVVLPTKTIVDGRNRGAILARRLPFGTGGIPTTTSARRSSRMTPQRSVSHRVVRW